MGRKPSFGARFAHEQCIGRAKSNYANYVDVQCIDRQLVKLQTTGFRIHKAERPASRASCGQREEAVQARTGASRLMRRSFHAASIAGGQNVSGTIIGTTLDGWTSTGNQAPDNRPSGRRARMATKLLSIGSL